MRVSAHQVQLRSCILVVDDDRNTREFLKVKLSQLGYDVVAVENESQAVVALSETRGRLLAVFLDLYLGGGPESGLCALDAITDAAGEMPVIVYSSKGIEAAAETVKRGAFWFIDKVEASDEEFAAVLQSILRAWHLFGKLVHSEAQRDFLQRVIDSIPLEIMARDKACLVYLENKEKTSRFGDVPPLGNSVKCIDRYDPTCASRPDREKWCVAELSFQSRRPESQYYTWAGNEEQMIRGAELLITAAPMGLSIDGREELVVETARDVSRQIGYLMLIQELARHGRADRDAILRSVVSHFVGMQERPKHGPGSQARIGFTTALAYLVEPRGGQATLRLRALGGGPSPQFDPTALVRRPNPSAENQASTVNRLWSKPREVQRLTAAELRGLRNDSDWRSEDEPYLMTGEVEERLFIPICVDGSFEGFIVADKDGTTNAALGSSGRMDWEDLHWARLFAGYLSEVFENSYRLGGANWLLDTERSLARASSVAMMFRELLARTGAYFHADGVEVFAVRDPDHLVLMAGTNHAETCRLLTVPHPIDIGVVGRACRDKQEQFIGDCSADPDHIKWQEQRTVTATDEVCSSTHSDPEKAQSMAVVPFTRRGQFAGVLSAFFKQKRSFDSIDREILRSLAAGLSMAFPAVEASAAMEERKAAVASLRDLYWAAVSAVSEAELLRYCLTYLTAGQGLRFNRALFFGAQGEVLRCQDGIGHPTKEGWKPIVDGLPEEQEYFRQLLRDSARVDNSLLVSLFGGSDVPLQSPLGKSFQRAGVTRHYSRTDSATREEYEIAFARAGMGEFLVVGVHVGAQPIGGFAVDRPFTGGLGQLDEHELHAFGVEAGQFFAELRHKKEWAAQRDLALLGRVAGFVAHDLTQPLAGMAAVISVGQSALSEGDVPRCMAQLQTLEERRTLAVGMLDALKNFCDRAPKRANLVSVVRDVLILISHNVDFLRVEIRSTFPSTLVPEFDGYPGALISGLANICQNSLDAIRKRRQQDASWEGGCIRVQVELDSDEHVVRIVDDGIGMTDLEVRQFQLADPFSAAVDTGGAGLDVARQAAALNGGRIEIQSEPNRGTTVAVHIPIPENV